MAINANPTVTARGVASRHDQKKCLAAGSVEAAELAYISLTSTMPGLQLHFLWPPPAADRSTRHEPTSMASTAHRRRPSSVAVSAGLWMGSATKWGIIMEPMPVHCSMAQHR